VGEHQEAGARVVLDGGRVVEQSSQAQLIAARGGYARLFGLLAGFAVQQRRATGPLVERSLFADRGFPAALVVSTLFFGTALGRVGPAETGSAAGLLNAVQQLGGILGTAVLGSVVLAAGAPDAFLVGAGLLVLSGPACLDMLRRPGR
jgi:hypothetical protein